MPFTSGPGMAISRIGPDLWQDARYGVRVLLRARAQAALAIATIAVAIGANTTIFSVVNATMLAPLPFPDAGRVMQVAHISPDGEVDTSMSVPKYLFIEGSARSFAAIAAYQDLGGSGVNLTGPESTPERVGATRVASSFFTVLGIQPFLGRGFHPDDNRPGAPRVVVLSHRLWARRFGASPAVLGRTITVNDEPSQVVGVMPASFRYPDWAELWTPLEIDPASSARHGFLDVVGRLRPGVTLDAARAEMRVLAEAYERVAPGDMRDGTSLYVRPLQEALYGFLRPALLALMVAVGAVLLVACVNVANLQLARALARTGEVALRFALGATRARVIRQLLVESAVLALAGGVVGLWLTAFTLPAVLSLAPPEIQGLAGVSFDVRVLAFTTMLALLSAVLFGIMPARAAAASSTPVAVSTRGVTGAGANSGARRTMIAIEVALAIMLATGAGLLARTFVSLVSADPGFDPRRLSTLQLHFSGSRYESGRAFEVTATRLVDEVKSLPGVTAAALSTSLPFGTGTGMSFTVEGRAHDPQAGAGRMRYVGVTPEFFDAMGISLVRGRAPNTRDTPAAPLVAVLNETAARLYWPDADPIGQHITIGQPVNPEIADPAPREIVGIVGDVREYGMDMDAPPVVYVPLGQVPAPLALQFRRLLPLSLTIRSSATAEGLAAAVQAAVLRVDPLLPVTRSMTGEQMLAQSLEARQFNAVLMGALAVLAVILALSGIYGVLSCLVAQRSSEIGVRLALGATRGDIFRLVLAQGLAAAGVGASIGVAGALLSARLLAPLLVNVSSRDPLAIAAGTCGVLLLAAMAAYVPARRAARVDPLTSIRAGV